MCPAETFEAEWLPEQKPQRTRVPLHQCVMSLDACACVWSPELAVCEAIHGRTPCVRHSHCFEAGIGLWRLCGTSTHHATGCIKVAVKFSLQNVPSKANTLMAVRPRV